MLVAFFRSSHCRKRLPLRSEFPRQNRSNGPVWVGHPGDRSDEQREDGAFWRRGRPEEAEAAKWHRYERNKKLVARALLLINKGITTSNNKLLIATPLLLVVMHLLLAGIHLLISETHPKTY